MDNQINYESGYVAANITESSKSEIDSLQAKLSSELNKHIALVAYEKDTENMK